MPLSHEHALKIIVDLTTWLYGGGTGKLSASTEPQTFDVNIIVRMRMKMKILPGTMVFGRQCRCLGTLRSTVSLPNHTTPTLRQHPPLSSGPPPTFPFLNPDIVPPRPNLEESSPVGKIFKLTWPSNPRNILIIKKRRDEKVKQAAIAFARYYSRFGVADPDMSTKSTLST